MPAGFEFSFTSSPDDAPVSPETPFRIGIVGDFSGRAGRGSPNVPGMAGDPGVYRIDIDNMEDVFAEIAPRLCLPVGENADVSINIEFGELEDFHPDALLDRVELFSKLRDLRGRLKSPSTFAQAAAELAVGGVSTDTADRPEPTAETPTAPAGSMLDQLLGGGAVQPVQTGPLVQRSGAIDKLVQAAVGPYVIPLADPRQDQCMDQVNAAMAGQLSSILHHPSFQQLEAAWRGVDFLLTGVEMDDPPIRLYLIDVPKSGLLGASDGESLPLSGALIDRLSGVPGEAPWGLLLGCDTFGSSDEDVAVLGAMSQLCAHLGAPFIAAGEIPGCSRVTGTPDSADWGSAPAVGSSWQALRASDQAGSLALVAPRFLMRLPYGRLTDPVDGLPFEELDGATHETFLWGSGAFLAGALLGRAYGQCGWAFRAEGVGEIGGLPVCTVQQGGDTEAIPCAEAWISDRVAEDILSRGLSVAQSIRGRDAVRLELRSLSATSSRLVGRWRG
ncbi:MAG: hypothetical protein HN742_21755 [Lentisphaerae bacterium]|jgi:type VI secretion system protein ImpC|nr:hypothetical protein [Lentisphaerota bacterium]MBT4818639.1 hypothetical protein [Lentisphaerota bacterium]MBT5607088.1 hypothetical protein [Lentisphaerota bacterium]MBT7057195.1 hypothetical protein [Lentisphaerota bacterium]MBT7844518.1 hypothetical protein [Lentisphaerota bacterium]